MPYLTISVIACPILLWVYRRRGKAVKMIFLTALVVTACVAAMIWGGPLSSGALLLLLPAPLHATSDGLPALYRPLHQGHLDLATGIYIREDEDIVLSDSPSFVWRRAYLSRYRIARELGVGTTHNAEWYLSGNPDDLQHIDLIREDGTRIVFDRTSRGSSYLNAMFVHTTSATEFYGARLGWVGRSWAMRFEDGSLAIFEDCGPGPGRICSIESLRDARGRTVWFKRDERGILQAIDAGLQRLTFDYDDQHRVVRAASGPHVAAYLYDHLGRLVRATVDGTSRSYRYGAGDEMTMIEEPGRSIENTYDRNSRLARQVLSRPGHPDYVQTFAYVLDGDKVRETTVTDNDGSRTVYRWNEHQQQDLEIQESDGAAPVMVQFARGGGTITRSITVFCKRGGMPVTETAEVEPGDEDRAKDALIARVCN